MSINPSPGSTSGTTSPITSTTGTTTTPPTDYLSLLGGLSPLPFDPNTVINGLLAIQQIPIQNIQTQIKNIQTNESIYKSIGQDVAALQATAFNLTLQSSVQANTAASSNTSAVTATASPNALAGSYAVNVLQLATATTATSTGGIGQAIDSAAASTPLSSLNLSGTPTAGSFSVVVDGTVQTVNVDPTKALLDPNGALGQLQSVLQTALPGATVNVGVSNDKVSISVSGATGSHSISFGAAGDSSNFLSLMNLTTTQGTTTNGALSLTSSANVGVAQPNAVLATAALATPLTGTPDPQSGAATGSFSINGVSISWNAGTDTLGSVINNINNSAAGVNAQYNSVTDQLVLTSKTNGQTAISLADTTGNFLAAMNLAPGTTNAQKLGANAQINVNGTTVTSTSNTITNAAPGLTINALALTSGTAATISVGPDVTGITKQVQALVDGVNKVINDINLTQQKDPTSGQYSQLLGDPTLNGLENQLITMITGQVTSSGTYQSLQDIGITTGAVGSVPGSTTNLTLDTNKLAAALTANPAQVAALFNGTTAGNGFQGVAQQLNTYLTQQTNPTLGPFAQYQTTGDAEIKNMNDQITFLNNMIDEQRQILTSQFSVMSSTLTNLAAESTIFAASGNSSSSSSSSGH